MYNFCRKIFTTKTKAVEMKRRFSLSVVTRSKFDYLLVIVLVHIVIFTYILFRSENIQSFANFHRHRSSPYTPTCFTNFTQSPQAKLNATWEALEKSLSFNLKPGGRYNPEGCNLSGDIVVVIPYRNREDQLKSFMHYMHPFLQSKNLSYQMVVVEMTPGLEFNRAMLLNIGFIESMNATDNQCFIFHDVDLLPEKTYTPYNCDTSPRHMAVAIDKNGYKLPYPSFFGGICALTKEHFQRINGFSNQYFGWGGEDDDFHDRLKQSGLSITRLSLQDGRYHMLSHAAEKPNTEKFELFKTMRVRSSFDGLNSLKYKVLKYELKSLYTWILVNINETSVKTFDREQLIKMNEELSKKKYTMRRKPRTRQ
ncbi:Beta-1 [Mactra antiquata]